VENSDASDMGEDPADEKGDGSGRIQTVGIGGGEET
jgi:hypothetical protein